VNGGKQELARALRNKQGRGGASRGYLQDEKERNAWTIRSGPPEQINPQAFVNGGKQELARALRNKQGRGGASRGYLQDEKERNAWTIRSGPPIFEVVRDFWRHLVTFLTILSVLCPNA
jgi:hypothetical protein